MGARPPGARVHRRFAYFSRGASMPTKKTPATARSDKKTDRTGAAAASTTTSARSTVSGPARKDRRSADDLTAKMDGAQALAAAMPFNANKSSEYGKASLRPAP